MASELTQLLPSNPKLADRHSFHRLFSPTWKNLVSSTIPYPIILPESRAKELHDLHTALHTALRALVRRWWSRPDFGNVIPVSNKLMRVLKELDRVRPYEVIGSYRPDFLISDGEPRISPGQENDATDQSELNGPIKICEINARFMFNGYMLSVEMDQAREKLGIKTAEEKDGRYHPSCGTLTEMVQACAKLVDSSRPIAMLAHKELLLHGCHDLNPMAAHLFPHARFVDPQTLRLLPDGRIVDDIGPIDQFLLELHQSEIEALEEPLLHAIARSCWNDLRTIYFVHDKRILYLLRRELEWLVGLGDITPGQAEVLRRGVAETYVPLDPQFKTVLENGERDEWTLKVCMGGKGQGMVFGKNVDEHTWRGLLESQYRGECASASGRSSPTSVTSSTSTGDPSEKDSEGMGMYVLQRYVKQKRIPLLVSMPSSEPAGETLTKVTWPLVGMMLCVDRLLLGISTWRTAPSDIIALSHGLGFAFPGITESSVPPTYTIPSPGPKHVSVSVPADARVFAALNDRAEQYAQVHRSLSKHGLAVVHLPRKDPHSKYIVALSQALGQPLAHSSSHGILWDVRPVEGLDSSQAARSETKESFPWHTDCSFELAPPRFFALHILHPDHFGGGRLRLLSVPHLLERLPEQTSVALQAPQFKFRVPREFSKETDYIIGAILMPPSPNSSPREDRTCWKMRYRRDVIEPMNEEAQTALDKVEEVLAEVDGGKVLGVNILGPDVMTEDAVVVVDNARFLHARSEINDPRRWLKRVRWGPEIFA